ncbi:DUF2726 domain-containing protein [Halochromatium salexigens]|nr:DUF2726 domain-containing protein [Halochromatium salexigens]
MAPLYVLLALASGLLLALIGSLLRGRGARLRGEPFERRSLLSADERCCHQRIQKAAGEGYAVFPRVSALALLQPLPRIGRRQRRLAQAHLREGWADLVICSAADAHPLATVRLVRAGEGRRERRMAARMRSAFAAAGMPVIELNLTELPTEERLRALVHEALAMTGVRLTVHPEPSLGRAEHNDDEETALLSELSAAMRDSEALSDR